MIKDWERPLVKGRTHEQALSIADDTGLRVWAVYAAAMECYHNKQCYGLLRNVKTELKYGEVVNG